MASVSAPFYLGIQQALAGAHGPAFAASEITLIYGAATAGMLYELEAFVELGVRVLAATDDGSLGFAGNVVQCLEHEWQAQRVPRDVRLLACGPEPMMAAVARLATERELDCWLSLETLMGCGVGICNACAVPTVADGERGAWPVAKCCVEGPVFDARSIVIEQP